MRLTSRTFGARPIVADGHGRYLCVSAPSLIWALRPFVEKALKEHDAASFKRFEHHRRAMVERRATAALAKALRADWAHEEIHYDGARDDQHGEIDGLLRIDTALLIVEAKASSMRPSARRLAQDSFRELAQERGHQSRHADTARPRDAPRREHATDDH